MDHFLLLKVHVFARNKGQTKSMRIMMNFMELIDLHRVFEEYVVVHIHQVHQ